MGPLGCLGSKKGVKKVPGKTSVPGPVKKMKSIDHEPRKGQRRVFVWAFQVEKKRSGVPKEVRNSGVSIPSKSCEIFEGGQCKRDKGSSMTFQGERDHE